MGKKIHKGNFLYNHLLPEQGKQVWALDQVSRKDRIVDVPVKGTVWMAYNLDELGYTRVDVLLENKTILSVPLSRIYDHKPKQEMIPDMFGEVKLWV